MADVQVGEEEGLGEDARITQPSTDACDWVRKRIVTLGKAGFAEDIKLCGNSRELIGK